MATKYETKLLTLLLSSEHPVNSQLKTAACESLAARNINFYLLTAKADGDDYYENLTIVDSLKFKYKFEMAGKKYSVTGIMECDEYTYYSDRNNVHFSIEFRNVTVDGKTYDYYGDNEIFVNSEAERELYDKFDYADIFDSFETSLVGALEEHDDELDREQKRLNREVRALRTKCSRAIKSLDLTGSKAVDMAFEFMIANNLNDYYSDKIDTFRQLASIIKAAKEE